MNGATPSLAQLADVAPPPPVPWMPQTVGWQVLGAVLAVLALWLAWRALRRYLRNRYRRDALAELRQLEAQWRGAPQSNAAVLLALPMLLKRCALSAWPREQTASLSGEGWARFMLAHAGHAVHGAQVLAPLVGELQYHDARALSRVPASEVEAFLAACRQWIEGHVPA